MSTTVKRLCILAASFIATGCATTGPASYQTNSYHHKARQIALISQRQTQYQPKKIQKNKSVKNAHHAVSQVPEPPSMVSVLQIAGLQKVRARKIPIAYNDEVEKWIDFFAVKDRDRFQRFMDRGEPYRVYIQEILRQQNLPPELYYLAMIESGFQNHARSHASAVGMWQFMKGTAKDYGLRVNYYLDERKDPLQATYAAGSFLRDLYNSLGSWNLAIAAYNCGLSRVRRKVKRAKTENFWELSRRRMLPKETRDYIPEFMAAVIIGQNPEEFGFRRPQGEMVMVDRVRVPGGVTFKVLSRYAGVSVKDLKKFNPHLRRKITPPYKSNYEVWVPRKLKGKVESKYAVLKKHRQKKASYISANGPKTTHKVRRGDSLIKIAKKYGVSVSSIKSMNRLKGSRIFSGQRLKIRRSQKTASSYHKVKKGENLSSIAKKYGLTLSRLKKMSGLRGSKIYVGQKLRVIASQQVAKVKKSKSKSKSKKSRLANHYRVRKGDNLSRIADLFGSSVGRIKRMNGLRTSKIYVGQKLKLR